MWHGPSTWHVRPRDTSGTTEEQIYIGTRVAAVMRSFDRAWHVVYQDSTAAILPPRRQRLRAFPRKERGWAACSRGISRGGSTLSLMVGWEGITEGDKGEWLRSQWKNSSYDETQPREKGAPSKMAADPGGLKDNSSNSGANVARTKGLTIVTHPW